MHAHVTLYIYIFDRSDKYITEKSGSNGGICYRSVCHHCFIISLCNSRLQTPENVGRQCRTCCLRCYVRFSSLSCGEYLDSPPIYTYLLISRSFVLKNSYRTFLNFNVTETSDKDEERGIYAIPFVIFLIPFKYALDGLWITKSRSFPHGLCFRFFFFFFLDLDRDL